MNLERYKKYYSVYSNPSWGKMPWEHADFSGTVRVIATTDTVQVELSLRFKIISGLGFFTRRAADKSNLI